MNPPRNPSDQEGPSLERMDRTALLALAKEKKIRNRHRMTKAQLIEALSDPSSAVQTSASNRSTRPAAPRRTAGGSITEKPRPRRAKVPKREAPIIQDTVRLTLLPIGPYWIHAFWEIPPDALLGMLQPLGRAPDEVRLVLRLYDVTGLVFDGANAHRMTDIPVLQSEPSTYIRLRSGGRTFMGDLGCLLPDGRFLRMARSGPVHTPRDTHPGTAGTGVGSGPDSPVSEEYPKGAPPPPGPFAVRRPPPSDFPMNSPQFWRNLEEASRIIIEGHGHPSSPGGRRELGSRGWFD